MQGRGLAIHRPRGFIVAAWSRGEAPQAAQRRIRAKNCQLSKAMSFALDVELEFCKWLECYSKAIEAFLATPAGKDGPLQWTDLLPWQPPLDAHLAALTNVVSMNFANSAEGIYGPAMTTHDDGTSVSKVITCSNLYTVVVEGSIREMLMKDTEGGQEKHEAIQNAADIPLG